jgi:hypothetical protein
MNSRDRLDVLLDSSAADAVTITDAITRDLDAATAMAESQVTSERSRSRRTPRLAVAFGLAVLLTGGAGAAVAAGGFDWLPWAQTPDVSYPFTLPSGRECEIRLVLKETEPEAGGDWDAFVENVSSIAVDPVNVERWVTTIRNEPTTAIQVLNADGQLEDPIIGTEPTEDDRYATANYFVLSEQLGQASVDAGIELWWSSGAQMLCEAVAP